MAVTRIPHQRPKFRVGLLIALALAFATAPKAQAASIWRSLVIKPDNQYVFAGEVCTFTLKIPGYAPNRIDTTLQAVPDNVALLSTLKEEYIENGRRSTKITFQFRFSKSGTYQIRSLAARIDWTWSYIPFQKITVYDNPITLSPELYLNYPKEAYESEPFEITVIGHFFSEFTDITAELGQNYIVRLKESLKTLPFKTGGFSSEEYPVAVYEIIPLSSGTMKLPAVTALMRSYAGVQQTIVTDSPTIRVRPLAQKAVPKTAAAPPVPPDPQETARQVYLESAYEDFPIIEITLGADIPPEPVEIGDRWTEIKTLQTRIGSVANMLVLVALAGLALLVVALILKHFLYVRPLFVSAWICLFGGLLLALPGFWYSSLHYVRTGETDVHTIPEADSNTVLHLPEGTVVQVVKETQNWYCISSSNAGLVWIEKDGCLGQ